MKESNKAILDWLKDEGAISIDDNLIIAEKAFFVNSVVKWSKEQVEGGTMKKPQIDNCMFILRRFLKGKLDLCWDNGIIKVQKIPSERSKKCKR